MSVETLPLISVQIVTYNQQNFVGEAIESVLKQDYPNLEIIISDDCSTDDTPLVAGKYLKGQTVRYYRNEKNIGAVKNCRKSLYDYCRGDWVVNLDGDDYITCDRFLSDAMTKILQCGGVEKVMFYQATVKSMDNRTNKEYEFFHRILSGPWGIISGKEYFMRCYENKFFSHLATVYNRQRALDVGFYENDIPNSDLESMLKLSLHGSVILENKVVGTWRIHKGNVSSKFIDDREKELKTIERIADYAGNYLGKEASDEWGRNARKAYVYLSREELARTGQLLRLFRSLLTEGNFKLRSFILVPKALLSLVKRFFPSLVL